MASLHESSIATKAEVEKSLLLPDELAVASTASALVGFACQPEHMLLHRGRQHHPEKPERLTAVLDRLRASGLLDRCRQLSAERLATDEELLAVHTAGHLERVAAATRAVQDKPDDRALREPQGDGAIYYHEHTERAARCAAGSTLEATDAVLLGRARTALALVRPPGHHAERDEAMGFCFYNNAAVAAAAARREHRVERVAIVDWDVHHGNGTQHIFEEEAGVLFVSLHRCGRGFFPGTGHLDEVGRAAGVGRTVNVPWLQAGLGDADYAAAFALVVMPILREFDPQLLLISAGFDAAEGDVQGKMRLSPAGFVHMTRQLLSLQPRAKAVVVFEGGYHLDVSAACTEAVLRAMIDEAAEHAAAAAAAAADAAGADGGGGGSGGGGGGDGGGGGRSGSGSGGSWGSLGEHTELLLRRVIAVQREHWPCLRTEEHARAVDQYFTRQSAGARKRGRS